MKILAVGDFHGKFPNKIKKYAKDADVIICPGDISSRKERKYLFKYYNEINSGIPLSYFVSKKILSKLFKQNLKSMAFVIKELDKLGKPVYIVPGNSDFTEIRIKKKVLEGYGLKGDYPTMQEMIKKTKNLKLIFHSRLKLGNFDLIGFTAYAYLKKPLKVLKKLFSKAKQRKVIFLAHEPPYGTKLDKIKNKSSPMYGKHAGNEDYNHVIKKYKPVFHICGHIHESQGKIKLGKTTVVNVGYGAKGQFTIIDLNDKKINVKFIR